jgi:hypothetical protein
LFNVLLDLIYKGVVKMLSTKDLIDQLLKYPDGTEWESLGGRCIASELGIIDMEPMAGNDLSKHNKTKDKVVVNSCDGCSEGLLVKDGVHYTDFWRPRMSCQSNKYKDKR